MDLYEEKWEWITGEKIPLANKYWGEWPGCAGRRNSSPCDDDGSAKLLVLYRDGKKITFVNATGGRNKYICHTK